MVLVGVLRPSCFWLPLGQNEKLGLVLVGMPGYRSCFCLFNWCLFLAVGSLLMSRPMSGNHSKWPVVLKIASTATTITNTGIISFSFFISF